MEINVVGDGPEVGEVTNCRLLWRACIAQALRDLVCANVEDALDAARWLGTPDYQEACDHASINADWLEQQVRGALAMREPYKRYHIIKLSQKMNIGLTSGAGSEIDRSRRE